MSAGALRRFLDPLSPPLCLICRARLVRPVSGPTLCPACREELDRTEGRPLRGDGLDGAHAALPYSGAGRRLVHALKFGRLLAAADLCAALIASRAPPALLGAPLVPVPPAPLRLAARGFDPATEIARALSASVGVEFEPLLRRRDLRRQRGSSRGRRLARSPRVRAVARAPTEAVLIDDVVTTGATLSACAEALRAAGSTRVGALAVAGVAPPRQAFASRTVLGIE